MKTDLNKTILSLTFLQVISAIAVVYLHTNGCFWRFSSTERYWKTANIIECVFYFAVPIFFMISGVTLINFNQRYSIKQYFYKRFIKTVIPFVAWSLIGVVYKVAFGGILVSDLSISYVINGILGTSIISIYSFFITLFCVYLCLPLLAAVPNNKRKEIFTYLLVSGFILSILIPFIKKVFNLDFVWPFSMSVISGYLIWPVAGYLLHYYPPTKKIRVCLYICAIAGLVMHIVGTYKLSMEAGSVQYTMTAMSGLLGKVIIL